MAAGAVSFESGLNLKDTELTLGLPGTEAKEKQAPAAPVSRGTKRSLADANEGISDGKENDPEAAPPVAKAQVVGWPPVRSYRKNTFQAKKAEAEASGMYVKVSMDGAPYLRKIDLKVYQGYKELLKALEGMFKCFIIGEHSRKENSTGSEYALTYEDKDGDWMLVGDVPFDMFISSCKRLRIMKGSEARGLGSGL
ncbi:hypothetical protein H6P81_004619 [Aristolochia fimbriata]|uniref:Auxin-responsive protein n=1 Tax=Aristolochia fimbriata TaxID=158543 RepID=A0AAV7ES67_ARIFI|nr:hypothetical protein H6P81_004619 [Aristolochia fimbriata]